MTNDELQFDYLLSHVRLHSTSNPRGWSAADVIKAFYMLPPPAVSFVDWKAALPPEMGLTEEDMAAANNFAEGVSAAQALLDPGAVTVKKADK